MSTNLSYQPSSVRALDVDTGNALNTQNVARIQQVRGYPAVSILLTGGSTRQGDGARLAGLVETAAARLFKEFSRPEVQPLLDDLAVLAAAAAIPRPGRSLALFANRDLVTVVALPMAVRERVIVDETFATRDLVHALLRSPRYRVLVLGADVTRLYAGIGAVLVEVIGDGFPLLGVDGTGDEQPRYGVDRSAVRDARLRRHLHAVDAALAGHLRDCWPLLVVGADRRLSLFRQHSRHRAHLTDTSPGTFERRSTAELAQAIWPSVAQMVGRRQQQAMAELDRATGFRRCAFGVHQVWARANEGRGALIVVEENYAYPARIDPHLNDLVPADDVEHPDVIDDVVDEIIEIVLAHGGRAVIVPDGTLPSQAHLAMTLRH